MSLFNQQKNKTTLQHGLDRDKGCCTSHVPCETEAAHKEPEKKSLFKNEKKPGHQHLGQGCGCEKH